MPHLNTITAQAKEIAFNALFSLLPINFSVVDNKGYLLGCNKYLLHLFNVHDFYDVNGKHMCEFASSECWKNTQKVIETGETSFVEESHVAINGDNLHFLSVKTPIKSPIGEVIGVVIVATNITDKKITEFNLMKAQEKEKLSIKAKDEFLIAIQSALCTLLGARIELHY